MARGKAAEETKKRKGKAAKVEEEEEEEHEESEQDVKEGEDEKDENGQEAEDGDGQDAGEEEAEEEEATASGKRKKSSSSESSSSKKARSASDAHSAVLAYMTRMNRPYSAINVHDNMQGALSKTQAVKVLDDLVANGSVTVKEFGKSRIYWATQKDDGASPEDVNKVDRQTEEVTEQLNKLRSSAAALQSEVNTATAEPDGEALDAELAELEKAVPAAEKKLAAMKGGKDAMPAAEVDALQRQFNLYLGEWKKRKRGCRDLIAFVSANAAKSWKEKNFCDDQGIETDEVVKVKIDDWQQYVRDVKPLPKEVKGKGKKK